MYVGGLVGYNAGTITKSYATGNVTNNMSASTSGWGSSNTINTYIGGLIGLNISGGTVSQVFATGNITYTGTSTGTRYVGRVVGRNQGTTSALYGTRWTNYQLHKLYYKLSKYTFEITSAFAVTIIFITNTRI